MQRVTRKRRKSSECAKSSQNARYSIFRFWSLQKPMAQVDFSQEKAAFDALVIFTSETKML
jgi:hypothetical protein